MRNNQAPMFLCARNVASDDVETMLRLFLPQEDERAWVRERTRWNRLWRAGLPQGIIMEDLAHEGGAKAVGCFVAATILPALHDRLVAPDGPALLDGIADAAESGEFPRPDETAIGRANADAGLDMTVFWIGYDNGGLSPSDATTLRIRTVTSFVDLHAGNKIRRFSLETDVPETVARFRGLGLEPLRERAGASVLSMDRERGMENPHLGFQQMFAYSPPLLGFSPAQRAILLHARHGFTDQEIATALGKTTDSVKKRWSGIYARFSTAFPGRLPASGDGSRGQEKRRTLLAYLKDRPEELRPYGG